jgi:hypothetical protein
MLSKPAVPHSDFSHPRRLVPRELIKVSGLDTLSVGIFVSALLGLLLPVSSAISPTRTRADGEPTDS